LILRNDKPIALFTHNHRGECESLVTLSDGKEHHLPFGQCSEFLIGGGSTPLELSENALVFIQSLI
ncbi:MAG TPA: hypothetical protein PLS71_23190, partial [Leptospiraceae bacterium]|nr:hypothetical protein [Leptospiraceae bacterium]